MEKLVLTGLLLILPLIGSAHGISNVNIVAESTEIEDIVLSLEFGDYEFLKNNRLVPTLNSGTLSLGEDIVDLTDSVLKKMGKSFVLRNDDVLIYARNMGENEFTINLYFLDGAGLKAIKLVTDTKSISDKIIPTTKEKETTDTPKLTVLVQQDSKNYWRENYDVSVKVFNKEINPNPEFHKSLGAIQSASVIVTLYNQDGKTITTLNGTTDSKGFWKGKYLIEDNLAQQGKYTVNVDVSYQSGQVNQQLEMFVLGPTPDDGSS